MQKAFRVELFVLMLSIIVVSGQAQEVPSADVSVQSINVTDEGKRLVGRIRIHNEHDDDAQKTSLIVLLPFQTKVLALSPGCNAVPSPSPFAGGVQGFVRCNLGAMAVGETKTVQITTTKPPPDRPKSFAAFVWNVVPDPNMSNNFREGTAP